MKFLGHTGSKREVQGRDRVPIPNLVLQTYATLLMLLKLSTPYSSTPALIYFCHDSFL